MTHGRSFILIQRGFITGDQRWDQIQKITNSVQKLNVKLRQRLRREEHIKHLDLMSLTNFIKGISHFLPLLFGPVGHTGLQSIQLSQNQTHVNPKGIRAVPFHLPTRPIVLFAERQQKHMLMKSASSQIRVV